MRIGTIKRVDCWAIEFDEGVESPSYTHEDLIRINWTKLQGLLDGVGTLSSKPIKMWSSDGLRRVGSRNVAVIIQTLTDIEDFTDLIIDISALPRSLYFPLIARALELLDKSAQVKENNSKKPNLHVFVSENPDLDSNIKEVDLDEAADFIHGFRGRFDQEATEDLPKVWIPILGENQEEQMRRILNLVDPDEVCPVLPFPSLNPRRGDDLILEYRQLLFDELTIELRNIIYASERNPFDAYREIRTAILKFNRALAPLGGCKTAISALSSKLLSVGALLTAYELYYQCGMDVGVAHVEPRGYEMQDAPGSITTEAESELFGLMLSGECYEP